MQYLLKKQTGEAESVELSEKVFNCNYNEPLIHQVVCAYAAGERQGTHAQKTRAQVSGGGKKPWRQKGTGRARAGSTRSPIWRGGGAAFAVKPRDYRQKINRKMYRHAMRSILSELIRSKRLIALDELTIAEPKTRIFVKSLKKLEVNKALIVVNHIENSLYLASRNVPNVLLRALEAANPIDFIRYQTVVITLSALKKLEENLL